MLTPFLLDILQCNGFNQGLAILQVNSLVNIQHFCNATQSIAEGLFRFQSFMNPNPITIHSQFSFLLSEDVVSFYCLHTYVFGLSVFFLLLLRTSHVFLPLFNNRNISLDQRATHPTSFLDSKRGWLFHAILIRRKQKYILSIKAAKTKLENKPGMVKIVVRYLNEKPIGIKNQLFWQLLCLGYTSIYLLSGWHETTNLLLNPGKMLDVWLSGLNLCYGC